MCETQDFRGHRHVGLVHVFRRQHHRNCTILLLPSHVCVRTELCVRADMCVCSRSQGRTLMHTRTPRRTQWLRSAFASGLLCRVCCFANTTFAALHRRPTTAAHLATRAHTHLATTTRRIPNAVPLLCEACAWHGERGKPWLTGLQSDW